MSLVFGKYEKIRRIAQGGMGEVFLARQTGVLDRLAILKALRPDLAKEKEFVEQFLDEARVAATLNHPNIVAIYDVGDWNGVYYIAMEYIAGEDLSKLWYAAAKAGVGLPFQVSVRIVMEAGLGLDHAHRAKDVRGQPLNIVHRDISPQNIMVRADGVTKLVDFGIAKAANKSSRTQAGMVKGKLQYMSPEQVRGEHLDGRSDQFSLGIVIWEMCTGRRLFKADSEINTLQKILQNPIPKPSQHVPGFPPELEAIIMRMLERDPGRRFASLGEVGARLKEYLDRAGLQSGEVSVAAFVQQILGKELEDRTRDLTPMEPTEVGAQIPTRPPGAIASSSSHAAAAAGQMRGDRPAAGALGAGRSGGASSQQRPPDPITFSGADDKDPPTAVVGPEDRPDHPGGRSGSREDVDGLAGLPSGPSGEWVVRKNDGSVVHFQEWATLQQWVLDGKLVRDDQLSTDGRKFARLGDDPQLATFFSMAEQAAMGRRTHSGAPVAADPSPTLNTTLTTTANRAAAGETVPIGDAIENLLSEAPPAGMTSSGGDQTKTPTPLTNDPFAGGQLQGGSPTGQFSLGSLPSTQTGQWQIGGDLQQALAQKQAQMAAAGTPSSAPNPSRPPDPTSMVMTTDPKGRAPVVKKKVPPLLWAMVGVLGSFVAIAVIIRVASPDTFRALREGDKPALSHAHAALAATRKDEPATVDALLQNLAPELTDDPAGAKGSVDADVAAALLHLERWRVLEATRLIEAARQKHDAKAPAPSSDPSSALAEAKKYAARAQAKAGDDKGLDGTWARFAAAVVDAVADPSDKGGAVERAAVIATTVPELVDEARANAVLKAGLKALEDEASKASVDSSVDAYDARAKAVRALVAAVRAVSVKEGKDKDAAVDAARAAVDDRLKKNPSDPRFLAARALLGEPKKAETPKPPETPKTPDPSPNVADAGVAVVAVPATVDAGVAAPVVEEETYETALQKAQKAARGGRTGEAAKMFRIALTKKPGDNKAELGLSWAQIDLGKADAAARGFKNVVTRDPNVAEAQFGLGEALRASGKTTEAVAAYEKYLAIAPNGPDAETAKNAIRALQ